MSSAAWVKLEVARTPADRPVWVCCLRATAEHYGWLPAFPEYCPPVTQSTDGARIRWHDLTDKRRLYGGKGLRISRSASRSGNPAALTNRFRVSSSWRFKDSLALAAATTADWRWMEGKNGRRRTRQEWNSLISQ
jgi:hypothetical protein